MKSISVDGKNYIKAGVIARDLGYTADYVGQLCRSGKIDAQLVGRSWYVNDDSIRGHKKGRYQKVEKNKININLESADTKKQIKTKNLDSKETYAVSLSKKIEPPVVGYANQSFYTHTPVSIETSYQEDESDLIPGASNIVTKSGRINVRLAGAQSVKVHSKNKNFDFSPGTMPVLRFKGTLDVTDAEDVIEGSRTDTNDAPELLERSVKTLKTDTKDNHVTAMIHSGKSEGDTQSKPSVKASKIKVIHRRSTTKKVKKSLPFEHNSAGILGMRRGAIVDRNPLGGTLKIGSPTNSQENSAKSTPFVLAVSLCTATVIAILISSFETTLVVDGEKFMTTYTLKIDSLIAAAFSTFQ